MSRSAKLAASAVAVVAVLLACLSIAAWHRDADQWTREERDVLASMQLRRLPPASKDPSNAVEGRPEAIVLGKQLFLDKRLSSNGAVSCASCHDPGKGFQDGLPLGRGTGLGKRRTMPVVGAGYSPWLFWDGRADSLWAQALGPLENPAEHGGTRARYARIVQAFYRERYEAVFGKLPDLPLLPEDASPEGTPAQRRAWDRLPPDTREDVSRIYANLGKAVAAYEKTITLSESRFDRYVGAVLRGAPDASKLLTRDERQGLRVFIGAGRCVTCHNGPLLTDQQFHNTGVPSRFPSQPDPGRAAVTHLVTKSEFNCLGRFSDALPRQCEELQFMVKDDPLLLGAFKTPSLRNVSLRPPYMHAGQLATLTDVVRHYDSAPRAPTGKSELVKLGLTEADLAHLVQFLRTLDSPVSDGS
jgi:cytochrome c peroxidase